MTRQEAGPRLARPAAIERVFDAPRELVWRAWTDPAHLAQWWLPEAFPVGRCSMEVHDGGPLRFCLGSSDAHEVWATGEFDELDAPRRLVCRDHVTHTGGNCVIPVWRVTSVTFDDLGDGRTKVTLR